MNITTTATLPDKPSELIRLALTDLKVCERDGVNIEMCEWYERRASASSCYVCLAGAVMRERLLPKEYDPDVSAFAPGMFEDKAIKAKLRALNDFRYGDMEEGLRVMGLATPLGMPTEFHSLSYSYESPQVFFDEMERRASILEGFDL